MTRLPVAVAVLCFGVSLFAQDTGFVKARGTPGAAGIFIDGNFVGPAYRFTVPEKYQAKAGAVEVTFRDPRYEDYTVKVNVNAHKTTKIHYTLKKLPVPEPPFGRFRLGGGEPESFMSIASGDTGAVYINDKYFGYVDELNDIGGGILIKPGNYTVHVVSPMYGDFRKEITITANKVTVIPLPGNGSER